jgi:hypothetical protein
METSFGSLKYLNMAWVLFPKKSSGLKIREIWGFSVLKKVKPPFWPASNPLGWTRSLLRIIHFLV